MSGNDELWGKKKLRLQRQSDGYAIFDSVFRKALSEKAISAQTWSWEAQQGDIGARAFQGKAHNKVLTQPRLSEDMILQIC